MAGATNKALAKAGMTRSQIETYRADPPKRDASAAFLAAVHNPKVRDLGLRVSAAVMAERRKLAAEASAERSRMTAAASDPRKLRPGEEVDVGDGITISKAVSRAAGDARDASGRKVWRSSTSYAVKRGSRILDIATTGAAALTIAKRHSAGAPTPKADDSAARRLDRLNERAAREAAKNRAAARRVTSERKRREGKRIL